ncbi:aldolase/citrate lyase family protein [Luteolibacter sp. SL250]|uniref:HpcH/HpaI aldolase family protein n=1 Tax=Luteolibacter sp. SL250 TaxID=2995170 RepID=UPI002271077B|nr:aldolase/citrate lyase family protein [Luteolibacter sp. SL250]WAC20695.1 aldolase/citrate lyase family protein [Luteolibacter sp. SL250]
MIGSWLSIGSPVIAEIAARSGFDWLLLDLEHGNATEAAIPDQLRAISGTSVKAIVRVGAPYPDLIARVLDWGADGIMAPRINSAAEAEALVSAAHYAPRGNRGYSRSSRAYGYGLQSPSSAAEITPPLIMAQIETIEGVRHASEIAAVPGIDVLFVGPADLQFDLNARPEAAAFTYAECLGRVNEAARAHGKATGILVRDHSQYHHHLGLGFTHIAIDSDLSILRNGYQQILTLARTQLIPNP